jgi:hypothetical protein
VDREHDEEHHGQAALGDRLGRIEPVVALAAVEQQLRRRDRDRDEDEAGEIERPGAALLVVVECGEGEAARPPRRAAR